VAEARSVVWDFADVTTRRERIDVGIEALVDPRAVEVPFESPLKGRVASKEAAKGEISAIRLRGGC
jgi:hypothetical protein